MTPASAWASTYSCAGTNTDVCDPAGSDVCWPIPSGLWECFTAVAGETVGAPGATTYTIYDGTGSVSGAADSYVTYGVDSLGNGFCCTIGSSGFTDIFVHTGIDGDTLSFEDTSLGLQLQPGSLGLVAARTSGGPGDDELYGSSFTGPGYTELLAGNDGDDYAEGHAGGDVLEMGIQDDTCDAGPGFDLVYGNWGDDDLAGGADDDVITGGNGSDIGKGGAGLDDVAGNGNVDYLSGGDDADIVWGGDAADVVCGDDASGGFTDTDLQGDAAADTIWGNEGSDAGDGGAGADVCGSLSSAIGSCAYVLVVRPAACP